MRRTAAGVLWLAAVVAPATGAWAQAPDCGNPQTQTDLNRCAYADYVKADGELNRLYKQLREKTGYAAELEAAERAWLAYRDKECDFETAADAGGSIRPMDEALCLKALTERRNADFRRALKCRDDAATCPY